VNEPLGSIKEMLADALEVIDHSIATNQRDDGLYHAYNLMDRQGDGIGVDTLYPMLEGQVAALSSGAIAPEEAVAILDSLYQSDIYRADQNTFMLYPDRQLPRFLEKNRIPAARIEDIPLLQRMLAADDNRIVSLDVDGCHRFSSDFANVGDLVGRLDGLAKEYGEELEAAREPLISLYEEVFNHRAFTGRSGAMFGFEGLGCIYWHMVSKLLLAVQENYFRAVEEGADETLRDRLGDLYYRVRAGIGFNKSPDDYGAFPADPYSHTPKHAGARQPGMTGQVKEEVITRFGELGVRVADGCVRFRPELLRRREFVAKPRSFEYLNVDNHWQELGVAAEQLAFTWCQVPVVYRLTDDSAGEIALAAEDGSTRRVAGLALSAEDSQELFRRSGVIRRVTVAVPADRLLGD
jgi:hypothetical protein